MRWQGKRSPVIGQRLTHVPTGEEVVVLSIRRQSRGRRFLKVCSTTLPTRVIGSAIPLDHFQPRGE